MMAWWIIPAAYVVDRLIGDPRSLPHPVIWMGKWIKAIEQMIRLRIPESRFKSAGLLLPLFVVGASFGLTWVIIELCGMLSPWLAIAAQVWLISTTIASKGLKDAGMEVYHHLKQEDMSSARHSLGMIVGRDTAQLEQPEVVRGTVETVAENIVDAIISPLLFALIGGAPLAMAYRAVNTLDSMVGYKNEKYKDLGWASARLDDIANYVPARLTAILLIVAAWMLGLNAKAAARTIQRDASSHPSPNSGYPESAVAGALGIRLGGENVYHGIASFRAYMGDNSREMEAEDIPRTVRLMFAVCNQFVLLGFIIMWLVECYL